MYCLKQTLPCCTCAPLLFFFSPRSPARRAAALLLLTSETEATISEKLEEAAAMDALRKQLDVLMGANRNGDAQEVTRKYFDRDVCRLFLAGLCPHELFQLTKMDKGSCPKVHSLQLRKEYEEAKEKGLDNYERDLEDNIDRLIVECDRKIERALKRLNEEDAKAAVADPHIQEMINEKLKKAEELGEQGMVDEAQKALEEADALKKLDRHLYRIPPSTQLLMCALLQELL